MIASDSSYMNKHPNLTYCKACKFQRNVNKNGKKVMRKDFFSGIKISKLIKNGKMNVYRQ